jgi:hypothetical protein
MYKTYREFLGQLSNYQLLRQHFIPWTERNMGYGNLVHSV